MRIMKEEKGDKEGRYSNVSPENSSSTDLSKRRRRRVFDLGGNIIRQYNVLHCLFVITPKDEDGIVG